MIKNFHPNRGANPTNIAIIKLSALGDIVHASIVLQFIKKHLPNAKISWFADAKFAEILKDHPLIDTIVTLPLKEKKLVQSYRMLKNCPKFDAIIDLQGLLKSALIAKILSKKGAQIYGFDKFSIKEPLASVFYTHKFSLDYNENIIVRNLALTAFALNFDFTKEEILNKAPCFEVSKPTPRPGGQERVLIAPFASEENKIYDKFDAVINLLKNEEIFICFGSENERAKAEQIAQNTHAKLLNKMSLKEMINFISGCNLTIGNDSGITHLAWAINAPSITLFGNRPSHRNAYETPVNLSIDAGKKIDAKKIDKSDFCVREIAPETIADAAKRLLYA